MDGVVNLMVVQVVIWRMTSKSHLLRITHRWPGKHWNCTLSSPVQCALFYQTFASFVLKYFRSSLSLELWSFEKSRIHYWWCRERQNTKQIFLVVKIFVHWKMYMTVWLYLIFLFTAGPSHFNQSYLCSIITNKQACNCIFTCPSSTYRFVAKAEENNIPSIKPTQ